MNTYKVLKFDQEFVYLNQEGKIKKLDRSLFDFDIQLGDKVDYMQDGDICLVLPSQEETMSGLGDDKAIKSGLLQGILNLFLETLFIHNNDLGNLKKIFSQLLITLFMAWSLLGVIAIEILLFVESLVVFIWNLLVRLLGALHIVDNSKKFVAYRKEKEMLRKQEEREEAENMAILAVEKEKNPEPFQHEVKKSKINDASKDLEEIELKEDKIKSSQEDDL